MKIIKKIRLIEGREVVVRHPMKGDEKKMLAYINELVKERVYIAHAKKRMLEDEKKFLGTVLKEMRSGNKFTAVFECDGKIISVIEAWKGTHDKNRHVCELALGLLGEYRSKGLGNAIMDILIDASRNELKCKIARISVYDLNTVAINLYRKYGFKEAGRIPHGINHFGKYCDEIIMVKELSETN